MKPAFSSLTVALASFALCAALGAQTEAPLPELIVRNAENGGESLAFDRTGRLLVTSGGNIGSASPAAVWDAATLQMLRNFPAVVGRSFVMQHSVVGLSRDGAFLVAGTSVSRVADGALLREEPFQDYDEDAHSFSSSADGRYAAVTASRYGHHGEEKVVAVIDFHAPSAPMRIADIPGGSEGSEATCFAPSAASFFAGVPLGEYATASGRKLRDVGRGYARVLACAPDARTFVALTGDWLTDRWVAEVRATDDGRVIRHLGPVAHFTIAAYCADGVTIVLANADLKRPYDLRVFAPKAEPARALHVAPVTPDAADPPSYRPYVAAIASGPSPHSIALSDWRGDIVYVDSSTNAIAATLATRRDKSVTPLAISPNVRWMTAAIAGRPLLWDLVTGQPAFRLPVSCAQGVAFSPDSRRLACATAGEVAVWDVARSAIVTTLHPAIAGAPGVPSVDAVAFDRTGERLFVTVAQKNKERGRVAAALYDLGSGTAVTVDDRARGGTILGVAAGNVAVMWPDVDGSIQRYDFITGRRAAIGRVPVAAVTWSNDRATGPDRSALLLQGDLFQTDAISSDGRFFISGGSVFPKKTTAELYDIRTGALLWTVRVDQSAHLEVPVVLGFDPDASHAFVGNDCGCGPARAYATTPVAGAAQPQAVERYDGVGQLAFTGHGSIAVTSSDAVRVWHESAGTSIGSVYDGIAGSESWLVTTPAGLFDGTLDASRAVVWRFGGVTTDFAPPEVFFNDFYEPGLLADIFRDAVPAVRPVQRLDRRQPRVAIAIPTAATSRSARITIHVEAAPADASHADPGSVSAVELFRNGTLVRSWSREEIAGSRAVLSASIAIVAGRNDVRAYAFNGDGVRSRTAFATVTGAHALARLGVAHILAIGLDRYSNPWLTLNHAADDARTFGHALARASGDIGRYSSVDALTLLDADATKAAMLAALKRIAVASRPEDSVFVYFAGHGVRRGERYYLVPYDVGFTDPIEGIGRAGLETLLSHAVSDLDLAHAFADVDASGIYLVIDACQSGEILESNERLGPMNARGLAQLAYDKGMYVLTASQGNQAALESSRLGHGLLTYALVQQGLVAGLAAPGAPLLYARPWLSYAQAQVPALQAQALDDAEHAGRDLSIVDGEDRAIGAPADRHLQRPRLYLPERSAFDDLIVARGGRER